MSKGIKAVDLARDFEDYEDFENYQDENTGGEEKFEQCPHCGLYFKIGDGIGENGCDNCWDYKNNKLMFAGVGLKDSIEDYLD